MDIWYYENNKSLAETARKYCTNHCIKRPSDGPSSSTIKRIIEKFEETCSLHNKPHGGENKKFDKEETITMVSNAAEAISANGDNVSIRKVAEYPSVDASTSTVRKVFRNSLGWKPYKYTTSQEIPFHCHSERVTFAQEMQKKSREFVDMILFSD